MVSLDQRGPCAQHFIGVSWEAMGKFSERSHNLTLPSASVFVLPGGV